MKKYLSLPLLAAAFVLGGCNQDSLPTGAERDLLNDPGAVAMGTSDFGQAVVIIPEIADPVNPLVPDVSDTSKPGYIHIDDEYNPSKYRPVRHRHIKDDYNHSKYKPENYEHIKTGDDQSKYKPSGWEHYNGSRESDKSKYVPSGYQHNTSGPNETRYSKTGTTTGEEEEPIGGEQGVH